MDIPAIKRELHYHHRAFIDRIQALPVEQLERTPNGKWSPLQHVAHIEMSVRPVAMAMMLPRWFLRWRFGAPNRAPRTYEGLVQRYQEKLSAGGRAPSTFVPPRVSAKEVESRSAALLRLVDRLGRRTSRWSEADLDRHLLPHPLLGKVTLREMLFFTSHHVEHHEALVVRDHS